MFKKIAIIITVVVIICMSLSGCSSESKSSGIDETTLSNSVEFSEDISVSKEKEVTEYKAVDEAEKPTEEAQRIDIRTEIIDGIIYSISGELLTSSLFGDYGPHSYMFELFSLRISTLFEYEVNPHDLEAVAAFCDEYLQEKEKNGFVISDLMIDNIEIDGLGQTGAVITFNAINESDMTFFYKYLLFIGDSANISCAEFDSFYDNREEIVSQKFDEFITSLSK